MTKKMFCYRGAREVVDESLVKTEVPLGVMQGVLGEEDGKD